jgi:predicted ATPase/class 3 adenylate cyclase
MSQKCISCRFINPAGMRYCGNCGTRLPEIPDEESLTSSAPEPEMMGAMVGMDLKERFRKAGLESAGQRRSVTVLFADLSGFTEISREADSEDLYEFVQQFIRELAGSVYKYEGMVDKFTGDGIMALFGAPIAHENNAERAVLAALDMCSRVAELGDKAEEYLGKQLLLHIGLNSGPVIVGGIGSDLLMNYTAIGDTVNLARRLEDAAPPGTILVSQSVYQQTKALFNYENAGSLELKGVDKPVPAYRAAGLKTVRGTVRGIESLHAPMVGRETELESLSQAVTQLAQKGTGQCVLLSGEAGIGKSRLIAELKQKLPGSQIAVVEGQSLTYRRLAAYWIFVDAFRKYLGVSGDTEEGQVRSKLIGRLKDAVGGRWKETLPYLEQLLSLSISNRSASDRMRYLDPGQLRQQIFLAVRDFLTGESQRKPILFILEDIHWADQTSLDLLAFLFSSLHQTQVMYLCVSRPVKEGPLAEIFHSVSSSQPELFHQIHLESLSPDQSEQLISYLLTIPELPPTLKEYILNRAAGVPFYLEEILRMLIDNQVIQHSPQGWEIAPEMNIQELGIPDSLEGLILARFDRLREDQRRTLQTASVIGREFNLNVLKTALQALDPKRIDEILLELTERDFVLPFSEAQVPNYTFKHAILSDAVYKTMLRKDRSQIHGKIGMAIEKVHKHRLDSQIEILARHFSYSQLHDRALHYLILAGKKAARNYDNQQARLHFEQARELFSKVDQSLDQDLAVFTGLGDVLVLSGEYPEARDQYLYALDAASGRNGSSLEGKYIEEKSNLHRKIGTTYERQGEYGEALNCLRAAEGVLGENITARLARARISNDTGWIHFLQGSSEEAEHYLKKALDLIEDSGDYDVIASIYNRLAGVYFQREQLDQASYYLRKSLVLREEMGDAVAVARTYNNLGLLAWRKGDWNQALENFQRSVDLHGRLNDVEGILNLHANIGLLQTDKGNLDEARHHLEESLERSRKIGHSYMVGFAYHHLSRLWLAAGEWEKSLFYSGQALQVFSEIGAQDNLLDVYSSFGEAWLALGNQGEAEKNCETAMNLIDAEAGPADNIGYGRVLRLKGDLARLNGDWDAAARLYKQSADYFSRYGHQLELGRTLVALARLDQSLQDMSAYRLHINEARLIFEQLGAKIDLHNLQRIRSEEE